MPPQTIKENLQRVKYLQHKESIYIVEKIPEIPRIYKKKNSTITQKKPHLNLVHFKTYFKEIIHNENVCIH